MERQNKTYEATPETAAYLDALRAWENFRNAFYCALCEEFGESEGGRILSEARPQLDAVGATVAKHLMRSILHAFGTTDTAANRI
jgi:hypothetical protein